MGLSKYCINCNVIYGATDIRNRVEVCKDTSLWFQARWADTLIIASMTTRFSISSSLYLPTQRLCQWRVIDFIPPPQTYIYSFWRARLIPNSISIINSRDDIFIFHFAYKYMEMYSTANANPVNSTKLISNVHTKRMKPLKRWRLCWWWWWCAIEQFQSFGINKSFFSAQC